MTNTTQPLRPPLAARQAFKQPRPTTMKQIPLRRQATTPQAMSSAKYASLERPQHRAGRARSFKIWKPDLGSLLDAVPGSLYLSLGCQASGGNACSDRDNGLYGHPRDSHPFQPKSLTDQRQPINARRQDQGRWSAALCHCGVLARMFAARNHS